MNTIIKTAEYGLLRLETTYNFMPKMSDINFINVMLQNILLEAQSKNIYFYCSISTQWSNYLKSIRENLILVNTQDREILYVRSVNKKTGRVSGVYMSKKSGKKVTTNKNLESFKSNLSKIISYLTFKKKPINILNVTKYKDEESNKKIKKIMLNLNSYSIINDKNDMSEFMFLVNTNLNYWRPNKKYSHDIKNTGIIDIGTTNSYYQIRNRIKKLKI